MSVKLIRRLFLGLLFAISIFGVAHASQKFKSIEAELVPDSEFDKIPEEALKACEWGLLARMTDCSLKQILLLDLPAKWATAKEREELSKCDGDSYEWIKTANMDLNARKYDLQQACNMLFEKRAHENPYRTTPTEKLMNDFTHRLKVVSGFINITDKMISAMNLKRKYGVMDYRAYSEVHNNLTQKEKEDVVARVVAMINTK